MNKWFLWIAILVSALVAGCGGGSDDSPQSSGSGAASGSGAGPGSQSPSVLPSSSSFDVSTAWQNYARLTGTFSVGLSVTLPAGLAKGSASLTRSPRTTTTFNAAPALVQVVSYGGSVSSGGAAVPISLNGTYVFDASQGLLHYNDGAHNWSISGGTWNTLPGAAHIGDADTLGALVIRGADGTWLSAGSVSWVLQADTESTAWLKVSLSTAPYSHTVYLRIQPSGEIVGTRIVDVSGSTVVTLDWSH